MTRNALITSFRFCLACAASTLAVSYAFSPWLIGAGLIFGLGLVWEIGQQRRWDWIAHLGLTAFLGLAALGIWLRLPSAWLVFAVVAALSSWDLSQFTQRLRNAGHVIHEQDLIRAHVRRAFIVAMISLILCEVALVIEIEFSFAWALALSLLAAFGLSRMIAFLRRESD